VKSNFYAVCVSGCVSVSHWFREEFAKNYKKIWILSALLTPPPFLKIIICIYSDYHSAGYGSIEFGFALFASTLLSQYQIVIVRVLSTIFAVEKQ
jgi:hypothetical protein